MTGHRLIIPEPFSAGVFLSYKCNSQCKHCLYACSPHWEADWVSEKDAERILIGLAARFRGKYPHPESVGVNYGLHFTGGEPFLNFDLLLKMVHIADELDIPSTFVETNCFWCRDDQDARERLITLKEAGLDGILVSVNPFVVEYIPFERIDRAVRIGREVFGRNAMVYQQLFYEQFKQLGLQGTLSFGEYLRQAGYTLSYMELLPQGRVSYKLAHLYRIFPARHFFRESCRSELIRDWHIHIDNYGNYIPGYCSGLSLGDGRDLDLLCSGINLEEFPVLRALLHSLGKLYELGCEHGYKEREGYISKCHLCLDIRRHLASCGEFQELKPTQFYEHLED